MTDLIKEYEKDARTRGLSSLTIIAYTSDIREFVEFIKKPMSRIDKEDIRDYIAHLRSLGLHQRQ